jgi:hypothetical protein
MMDKPRGGSPKAPGGPKASGSPAANVGPYRPAAGYRDSQSQDQHKPGGRRRDPLPAMSYLKGGDLWSAYQRLSALERDLQQIQPRLALKPLKLANQILVVTAGSPAVAARLRQFEPSLVEGLRARGWLVGRIRFRPIAVHDVPPPPPARIKEPVSPTVLKELETLDDAGMNPELQAALSSFVRRQKSYLGS